jgi:hypothetical protein
LLPIAEFCYNNTKSETLGITLFYANYGYHLRFQPDLSIVKSPTPDVSDYVASLNNLHNQLPAEIQWAQAEQAEQANKKRKPDPILAKGDKVWLKRKFVKTTYPSNKLDYKLLGPYCNGGRGTGTESKELATGGDGDSGAGTGVDGATTRWRAGRGGRRDFS